MRLSEAHADISVHLMTLNPGPGHGGMSCTSPSKSTFSMAWHHNRNAKNAQSPAEWQAAYRGVWHPHGSVGGFKIPNQLLTVHILKIEWNVDIDLAAVSFHIVFRGKVTARRP